MISTSELARLAGVSQSTVSRCLNDHPSISYETKERVRKLALQYGYVEHKTKRKTLFSGKRRLLGILIDKQSFFDDLFINYTINQLIMKASEKNYYVIPLPLHSNEEGGIEKLRDFLELNMIDGFIILHRHFDETLHLYLDEIGMPHLYLLHCSRESFEAVNIVDSDNYKGGYLGTQHLMNHGHKKIATLTCPWREFEERTAGYRFALMERGILPEERYTLTCECSYESAYKATAEHLELFREVTAIYVQSDIMTSALISALQKNGIRVPEDISVVGFDGYELGVICNPSFDSVSHPVADLVDCAITRLIEIIGSRKPQAPRQISLYPYIIERDSVRTI